MRRTNKQALYENIMRKVSVIVKNAINEDSRKYNRYDDDLDEGFKEWATAGAIGLSAVAPASMAMKSGDSEYLRQYNRIETEAKEAMNDLENADSTIDYNDALARLQDCRDDAEGLMSGDNGSAYARKGVVRLANNLIHQIDDTIANN